MKAFMVVASIVVALAACSNETPVSRTSLSVDGPIQLHPENPHYFIFKGKPLALITSAEHYGAVLNLDFDYKKYLEILAADGMNYTRIFTGTYYEIAGESFGIQKNTLAPQKDRVITPWIKIGTNKSGYARYDLSKWNEMYFERLKDFIEVAAANNIIVEVTLFSSIYRDEHWDMCPQNPVNNVNIPHSVTRFDAQTVKNGDLFSYQESFVRKMVNELNQYDNFFFEIQNEPWADHRVLVYNIINKELSDEDWRQKAAFADADAMAWQQKLAAIIVDEENSLAKKHLIAQNYTNHKAPIPEVDDNVSIMNFHYAWPEAVRWNYHYSKVIGFDESGFAGSGDTVYRRQAWRFMLSGGGLFNNLDYSFFVGHEDGTGVNKAPGGGSKTLRRQLKILSDFLHSFELIKLYPNLDCIESSPGLIPYILSDENKAYAVFLQAIGTDTSTLKLKTGDGVYQVQLLNTITGSYVDGGTVEAIGGVISIPLEIPEGDLALKIVRE